MGRVRHIGAAPLLAMVVFLLWLTFSASDGSAQAVASKDPGRNVSQSDVEGLAADLLRRVGRAGYSTTGENPDLAIEQDVRPLARKLIERLQSVESTSPDFVAGVGALSALAFSAGRSDEFAKRLGMEDGKKDLQQIDGLKEVAVKSITSSEPSVQGSGARILGIIYPNDKNIELSLVEMFHRTKSLDAKRLALFGIGQGGLNTEEAEKALVSAICDQKTAKFAIRALDEAGDIPPEAVPALIEILKKAQQIDTAGNAAEVLSKYYPERQNLDLLREIQGRLQSAQQDVDAAIKQLEGKDIKTQ